MNVDSGVKTKAIDKLTPQRKQLVEMIIKNLESGTGLWEQGWKMSKVPISAMTGKSYRGINHLFLSIISNMRGYLDNRWITFNQMKEQNWTFKTDEEGKSLGKNAGVTIEFFEFRDKLTQKPFDNKIFEGMTSEEREEYWDKNILPLRKYYRVFNGELIEGIPEKKQEEMDKKAINKRAEDLLSFWNEYESKIIYGDTMAYYKAKVDEIHLPNKNDFYDLQEFYNTAFHEVGHSTGHACRLNRDFDTKKNTKNYAIEELRVEIASMFMTQEFGLEMSDNHIQNNSNYIGAWLKNIKEDPNVLFTSIADADKITKFILEKEKLILKNKEYYAISSEKNESNDPIYKVYIKEEKQIKLAINYAFSSMEALHKEFEKWKNSTQEKDKTFEEVSLEELEKIYEESLKNQTLEEPSKVYIKPSKLITVSENQSIIKNYRGVESLTKMNEIDVVEKASSSKHGEIFKNLYEGKNIFGKQEMNQRSLMMRIAVFLNDDPEQLLRIFQSSGQYEDKKSSELYEKMANDAILFVKKFYEPTHINEIKASPKIHLKK